MHPITIIRDTCTLQSSLFEGILPFCRCVFCNSGVLLEGSSEVAGVPQHIVDLQSNLVKFGLMKDGVLLLVGNDLVALWLTKHE